MNDSENVLVWLQGWYAAQCDGDWEHERGVKIETLDNPEWAIRIDLEGTVWVPIISSTQVRPAARAGKCLPSAP
jgi:hypothetical protein